METLVFISHAQPEADSTAPASEWRLSHAGREAARARAEELRSLGLTRLFSSLEPKAVETARILGQALGVPSGFAAGLHEHDRSNLGFLPAPERFEALVRDLFQKPGERVFGLESADEAHSRFRAAVERLAAQYREDTLGIVSHGTVISLLVSRANGLDGFEFWKGMQMPDHFVLALPNFVLVRSR
ncbi:MAG: histidine phosphatase family protein [Chloroflexi bacterium]|nr:histidine phosphatase family protein [Chloroflexota bacterium]